MKTISYLTSGLSDRQRPRMTWNFLLLNSDKIEVIVLGPKNLNKLSNDLVTRDGLALASSTTVGNLGVIFDQDMTFNSHIKLNF